MTVTFATSLNDGGNKDQQQKFQQSIVQHQQSQHLDNNCLVADDYKDSLVIEMPEVQPGMQAAPAFTRSTSAEFATAQAAAATVPQQHATTTIRTSTSNTNFTLTVSPDPPKQSQSPQQQQQFQQPLQQRQQSQPLPPMSPTKTKNPTIRSEMHKSASMEKFQGKLTYSYSQDDLTNDDLTRKIIAPVASLIEKKKKRKKESKLILRNVQQPQQQQQQYQYSSAALGLTRTESSKYGGERAMPVDIGTDGKLGLSRPSSIESQLDETGNASVTTGEMGSATTNANITIAATSTSISTTTTTATETATATETETATTSVAAAAAAALAPLSVLVPSVQVPTPMPVPAADTCSATDTDVKEATFLDKELDIEQEVIPFLMNLGAALHSSGVPCHRLEYSITMSAKRFGLESNIYSTPTGVFFQFGHPDSPATVCKLIRIKVAPSINMEKIEELEALADQVSQCKISCEEGMRRISEISFQKPYYGNLPITLGFILSSLAIAILFGGNWKEILVTGLIGVFVALFNLLTSYWSPLGRTFEASCAFFAYIIAYSANLLGFISSLSVLPVVLGGVVVLLPGLTLTIAVAEISTRNLVSGSSRLVAAAATSLQLGFGLATGMGVCKMAMPALRDEIPQSPALPFYFTFMALLAAAISFSILLQAHPKKLWIILLASVVGFYGGSYASRWLGTEVGSFVGSFLICILGNVYARATKGLSVIPIMCGLILLVPGSVGIRAINAILQDDITMSIHFLFSMGMIAVSLVMGLFFANLFVLPAKAL